MSDSCDKLYNTLSNLNVSDDSYGGNNGTPQQSIGFTKSTATTTIDEKDDNLVSLTDFCGKNLTVGNEKYFNQNVLEFILKKNRIIKTNYLHIFLILKQS